jgi:hypothetical protein
MGNQRWLTTSKKSEMFIPTCKKWVQNGSFYPAEELSNGLQTTVWTLYYAVYSHTWFSDHLC